MPVTTFDPPERFVAGAVGPPGQRTFFLQARDATRLVSVSCEKQQVALLADRMSDLVEEYAAESGNTAPADTAPLETPIEDEFRATTISLGWDPGRAVVLVGAQHEEPGPDGEDQVTDAMHAVLTPEAARGFVTRARALVASGRPPCPFCGGPLDPTGHICPRANGYKR
jgi:uncharacterized repeat protein (TIGR03847 family)